MVNKSWRNFQLTRVLKVFIRGCPGLRHPQQSVLHDLDVGDGTVALGILLCALTDALVVMANVLPLSIAHNVAQSWLDKFLLQVFWKNDLKTWNRDKREVLVKHNGFLYYLLWYKVKFKKKKKHSNPCSISFVLEINEAIGHKINLKRAAFTLFISWKCAEQ